ncbi:MAG TPA: hypothetical protein VMU29_02130 [Smithella sp.]|nr:hypothetical protein [Smithella sp.]
MQNFKISIGFDPFETRKRHLKGLTAFKPYIHDLHFPHYNPQICASGRSVNEKIPLHENRRITMNLLSWNQRHTGLKLTLLLNYLLHDNYKAVVDNVIKEFYPRGVRSFVVADIELIKRLKDALPDCEIQGSCLSHRMTEAQLEEERKEGVALHNPSVNIIRDPVQLKRNHNAGYAQKVLAFEGCLHNCPDECSAHGHRWYLARNISMDHFICKDPKVALDPRYLFKANWVTIARVKTLLPYISVVKIPRGRHTSPLSVTKNFMRAFETDDSYDVVEFISAGYGKMIYEKIGRIPSHLFDDHFFDTADQCEMDCEKRECRLCFDMMEKIRDTNGGPIKPGIFLKSYHRLRDFAKEKQD